MRRSILLLIPLGLASCSQESEQLSRPSGEVSSVSDVAEAPQSGPGISVSAAPGVAFQYRYAFDLPAARIAAVQEEHAQACEKLGLSRCRITGMRYRLVGERHIEAMLAFKLDPSIARQFGKSGIEAVTRAEGKLIDSEITGHDAGAAIKVASRNVAQLTEDLRRIEEQLARKGLPAIERDRLQSEAQQLRQAIRASQDTRAEQEESLATTPMTFSYDSEDSRPPLREALNDAGDNFVAGISILLVALITLLPWLALAALVWAVIRLVQPRWARRRQDPASDPEAPRPEHRVQPVDLAHGAVPGAPDPKVR